jgi:hypothetical protein
MGAGDGGDNGTITVFNPLMRTRTEIVGLQVPVCALRVTDAATGAAVLSQVMRLHSLCTHCALTLHSLCTHCALTMHSLCTPCALAVHPLCTHSAPTLHSLCTHSALTLHPLCTHSAPTMHSLCTHCALTLHSPYTHHVLTITPLPHPLPPLPSPPPSSSALYQVTAVFGINDGQSPFYDFTLHFEATIPPLGHKVSELLVQYSR